MKKAKINCKIVSIMFVITILITSFPLSVYAAKAIEKNGVTMLTRGLNKAGINIDIDLDDVNRFIDDYEMHDWGREAIYFMSEKDIIKGIGDNRFNSLGNATCEQSLAIVLRSVNVFEK